VGVVAAIAALIFVVHGGVAIGLEKFRFHVPDPHKSRLVSAAAPVFVYDRPGSAQIYNSGLYSPFELHRSVKGAIYFIELPVSTFHYGFELNRFFTGQKICEVSTLNKFQFFCISKKNKGSLRLNDRFRGSYIRELNINIPVLSWFPKREAYGANSDAWSVIGHELGIGTFGKVSGFPPEKDGRNRENESNYERGDCGQGHRLVGPFYWVDLRLALGFFGGGAVSSAGLLYALYAWRFRHTGIMNYVLGGVLFLGGLLIVWWGWLWPFFSDGRC
jgi:hypothetical protein